ncbi:MAG: response regulator [Opitutaceae bacterium]
MSTSTTNTRVLVIDDEDLLTRIIERQLTAIGGYTVKIEHSALKAVETAREFMPDIIMLDIVMPELDGHAVAKMLRAQSETFNTPILHVSAMTSRSHTVGHLAKTEEGYFLSKPFMRKDLINALGIVLAESQKS